MRFSDWLIQRESTAFKRARTAAAKGLLPKQPGTNAFSHSTDFQAASTIGDQGCIGDKPLKKKKLKEVAQKPDYSFDRWVKAADELGSKLYSMVDDAKRKEADLDTQKPQKKGAAPQKDDEEEDQDKEHEETWKVLRDIAKERQDQDKNKKSSPSSKEPSKKSADSSSSPR